MTIYAIDERKRLASNTKDAARKAEEGFLALCNRFLTPNRIRVLKLADQLGMNDLQFIYIFRRLLETDKLNFRSDASDQQIIIALKDEGNFLGEEYLAAATGIFTPTELMNGTWRDSKELDTIHQQVQKIRDYCNER